MDAAADISQQINDLLRRMEDGVQRLTDAVNRVLSHVPEVFSWVVHRVQTLWNQFLEKMQEFWNWFTDKLSYVGNPFMLDGAAGGWREAGGVMMNQTREIDDSDLRVDDTWAGSGADQYRQSMPSQRDAMKSIDTDYASNIAAALVTMRNAIAIFWGAVGFAIIAAIAGVALATGEAISILGLPAVPPTAIGAIVTGLVAIGAATVNLYAQTASARDTMQKSFSGVQTWPEIVTG